MNAWLQSLFNAPLVVCVLKMKRQMSITLWANSKKARTDPRQESHSIDGDALADPSSDIQSPSRLSESASTSDKDTSAAESDNASTRECQEESRRIGVSSSVRGMEN